MPLTDVEVRQARTTGKAYILGDGRGLALAVTANGGKSWHFRYQWLGKRRRMSLGTYPEIGLKEARTLREAARALVTKGVNPQQHRKRERLVRRLAEEQVFQTVFNIWIEHRRLSLKPKRQGSLAQIQQIFRKDILPVLGKRSVYDITRTDLVEVLAKIEARDALTIAQKCRLWLRQLFHFAMVRFPGLERNPALDLSAVALPRPPVAHNPFLRMEELPLLLRGLCGYRGHQQTRLGLRLLLLTGVRTGELRSATPDQFDLERGLWIVPATLVKQLQLTMRKQGMRSQDLPPYVVPLSTHALEVARQLLSVVRPGQRYLLTKRGDLKRPISENTLNHALKSLGFEGQLTSHGIRATIATALNEYGYPKVWIDAQLSHADSGGGGAAYNHAEYVEERRRMMQDWGDRLDQMQQGIVNLASKPVVEPTAIPQDAGKGQAARIVRLEDGTIAIVIPLEAPTREGQSVVPVPDSPAAQSSLPDSDRLDAYEAPQLPDSDRLDAYEAPHNLPLSVYAALAGKPCEQIVRDIKAKRLLSLSLNDRGHRIPDWQLDATKYLLTLIVLTFAEYADAWDVYLAISKPMARLESRSPLDVVTPGTILELSHIVCTALGSQEQRES